MAKRILGIALLLVCLATPALATNTSTADPTYPASFDDIDSEPLRQQFDDIINDIDNLWAAIQPNFLQANQIIGALVSGKAVPLSMPSCFSATNALTWRPGVGIGCNDIEGAGGGSGGLPVGSIGAIQTKASSTAFGGLPLSTTGQVFIGTDGSGTMAPVTLTQDCTVAASGAVTCTKTNNVSFAASATTDTTNAANILSGTINVARLQVFNNLLAGIVPSSGGGTTNFLRADDTWAAPPGGSGSVNAGTSGQVGYYAMTGSALSGATLGNLLTIIGGVMNAILPQDRNVSGTSDSITSSDCGLNVVYTSGSNVAVSIATASSLGLTQGCGFNLINTGAATVTLTPSTSTINGKSSLPIPAGTGCYIRSNSTNYLVDYSACSALTIPAGSLATTPADNATCTPGQQWWDTSFIYLCAASGTVKRAALSTY